MKFYILMTGILLFFYSCCPQSTPSVIIRTDSVSIERIVRDSIYLTSQPEVSIIEYSKTFTVNPFEARTDTIVLVRGKETKIRNLFTFFRPDSMQNNLSVEEITGDVSRTVTKTELKTITKVVEEKNPWYYEILWCCFGAVLGIIFILVIKWK